MSNNNGAILPTTSTQSTATAPDGASDSKPRGANRSTKVAVKLKVLPEQPEPLSQSRVVAGTVEQSNVIAESPTGFKYDRAMEADVEDADADHEDSTDSETTTSDEQQDLEDLEVYNAIAQIPEGTARKDALKLTKRKAKSLPRVTAYCTATSYKLPELLKFFAARRNSNKTAARRIDNVVYTPYSYPDLSQSDTFEPAAAAAEGDLLGVPELNTGKKKRQRFDPKSGTEDSQGGAEVFMYEYGSVVIWGMSEQQEKRFLASIKRFEVEKLAPDDVEMEDLNYYYAAYSRIYNDVVTLRKGSSYMTKLALSHALAQSAKISLFEQLISSTIEQTRDIPETISETGQIGMPHREIMQQIGQLFILRMNLNLVGSVLDSPEVFWTFPDLQPLYDAARSYLEIPQRINLLNTRVEVLQDMLQLLKESVSSRHAERLETIVIWLIVIEIILGMITVAVDLLSGA
ncbi:DUF155-domain-containing protein [Auriculariales sp. MPI-PUGE-AT-0066]|nr:DUF155-domain-containing protein [Auriculariales sp. MPI-PUGE-AT-0066]